MYSIFFVIVTHIPLCSPVYTKNFTNVARTCARYCLFHFRTNDNFYKAYSYFA